MRNPTQEELEELRNLALDIEDLSLKHMQMVNALRRACEVSLLAKLSPSGEWVDGEGKPIA